MGITHAGSRRTNADEEYKIFRFDQIAFLAMLRRNILELATGKHRAVSGHRIAWQPVNLDKSA